MPRAEVYMIENDMTHKNQLNTLSGRTYTNAVTETLKPKP
jgi:hypothetical protein